MQEYSSRNALLRDMGYENYKLYLRSGMWKSIRASKLNIDKACYACGHIANQVHHSQYTYENLSGGTLKFLYSVCKRCHFRAEFTRRGVKRTPSQATDALKCVRKARLKRRRAPDKPGVFRRAVSAKMKAGG